MNDFLGNKLAAGDEIVFIQRNRTSSWLTSGRVERLTPKMVVTDIVCFGNNIKVTPRKVVKIK
jgi:hypothetical protein